MSSLLALVTASQMSIIDNPPMLLVQQTVSQSVPSSTFTTITYTNVLYDNYSGYNSGTSFYTAPVNGWYRAAFTIQWAANATPARLGGIENGGSNAVTWLTANDAPSASGVTTSFGVSNIIELSAGLSIQNVFGDQNSGAGLSTQVGTSNLTSYNSFFCLKWIAALPSS